jgi:hypothetical protein
MIGQSNINESLPDILLDFGVLPKKEDTTNI